MDDETGEVLWSHHYASSEGFHESAYAGAIGPDDDIYCAGRTTRDGLADQVLALRIDGDTGDLLWEHISGGPLEVDDRAWDIVVNDAGEAFVTGFSDNGDENVDFLTLKLAAADGEIIWSSRIGGGVTSVSRSSWMGITSGGDVIVAARTWQSGVSYDVVLFRLDQADGAALWTSQYNSSGSTSDDPHQMILDGEENPVVTGVSGGNVMTLRFDGDSGDLLWESFVDGPAGWYDFGNCLALGTAGQVYVGGVTDGGSMTSWDAAVIAYDLIDGAVLWQTAFNGADSFTDELFTITVDQQGDIYAAGYTYTLSTDMDILVLRYEYPATAVPFVGTGAAELSAWPNPFSDRTTFSFVSPAAGDLQAVIYDLQGRQIRTLAAGPMPAGEHPLMWDGRDDRGRSQPTGLYFIRVRQGEREMRGKILRLR